MSRRKARELVLCLVFEKDYRKDQTCEKLYEDLLEDSLEEIFEQEDLNNPDKDYIKNTFLGVFERLEQIDDIVSSSTIGWEYSRISKISMALLRTAVYEILYAADIPTSVAINEAVELSKRYDDPDAYTFINGVLGAVAKNSK